MINNKIILLDSNSLINRAFHALPPFQTTDGTYTNAIYGYVVMLQKLISEEKPTHICAVFDCRAKTFRHAQYSEYKATRKGMPEELAMQVPILQELLQKMGICILFKEGYEADDIIGTVAKKFEIPTIIVTGDRDCLQLVDDTTTVYNTKKGISEVKKYTPSLLLEEGFTPSQIIEYKGLAGDSSDNIPGCEGVGEKTAKYLLSKYSDIDGVYENIEQIKGKLKERLITNKDTVYLSKQLATINVNVPIEVALDDMEYKYVLGSEAKGMMTRLQFKNVIEKFSFSESEDADNEETVENYLKSPTAIEKSVSSIEELQSVVNSIPVGSNVYIEWEDNLVKITANGYEYSAELINGLFGDGISLYDAINVISVLYSADYVNVVFDAKKTMHFLDGFGQKLNEPYEDIFLMGYLINNTKVIKSHQQLLEDYYYTTEKMGASSLALYEELAEKIVDKKLTNLYYSVELPLEECLFEMEKCGFRVDLAVLNELNEKFTQEINQLLEEIYRIAGEIFNVNSTKQLGHILFEKLGLKHSKKTKTGFSVSTDILEELEHPIVNCILRYRELAKLRSTYLEGMKTVMNTYTGKVHTSFNQCLTATGRLSSTEPNLQNIPIRRENGREIRKMFVPAKGNVLVSADYSQIELRLLAHFSKEEHLLETYKDDGDIHALTASKIFNVPIESVTSAMRSSAKAVNFGIIYGISSFGLGKNAGVSNYQAKVFIEQYFKTYPKVKEYMNANVALAKENGYLTTLMGRIRYFPELSSTKHNIRAFGERAAMNMPLQGSASDIIKIAMLKVRKALIDNNLKAKLILQVHDELIIEAPEEEAEVVKKLLKENMESAVKLEVPLTVNVADGKNWYEAK